MSTEVLTFPITYLLAVQWTQLFKYFLRLSVFHYHVSENGVPLTLFTFLCATASNFQSSSWLLTRKGGREEDIWSVVPSETIGASLPLGG
jgi:hypothetical protein